MNKIPCPSVYADDEGRQFFCSLEAGHEQIHCALSFAGQFIYDWTDLEAVRCENDPATKFFRRDNDRWHG